MGRRKNGRKKFKGMFLAADLLESNAYRSLSHMARTVLIEFMKRRIIVKAPNNNGFYGKLDIQNNGKIIFTYNEAKNLYKISSRSFKMCLAELVEKGFIDIADQAPAGYGKLPSKYAISKRWENYGTDRFETAEMRHNPPSGGFRTQERGADPMVVLDNVSEAQEQEVFATADQV